VGAITAFLAATIAVVKTDIKKSLAYSTISQLGYMVMAIGVGAAGAGMFHLWTHAFFKALLFLGSGSVIHAVHTQEMPLMGGLRKKMPITYVTFLAATIAIAGVPFFSGFYSKDAILAGALAFGWTDGHMLPFILGMLAAAFTAFYMFRMLFLTFHGKPRDEERYDHAHESPFSMAFPLVFLGVLAIGSAGWQGPTEGWFGKFVAPYDLEAIAAEYGDGAAAADHGDAHAAAAEHGGDDQADTHAAPAHVDDAHADAGHDAHGAAGHDDHHDVHHKAHVTAMIMSILVAGVAILMAWLVYMRGLIDTERFKARLAPVHTVLQNMYFFDELYAATVYRFTLWFSWLNAAFDRTVIDGIVNGFGYLTRVVSWFAGQVDRFGVDGLVNGVGAVVQGAGEGIRRVHTGRIQTYLAYVSFSVLVLVLVFRAL